MLPRNLSSCEYDEAKYLDNTAICTLLAAVSSQICAAIAIFRVVFITSAHNGLAANQRPEPDPWFAITAITSQHLSQIVWWRGERMNDDGAIKDTTDFFFVRSHQIYFIW